MPTLRFIQSPDAALAGQAFLLDEFPMTLGREPANRLPLNDQAASREHAVIVQSPEGCWVQDLQSANGTFVNEQAVAQAWLRHGDRIRIGGSVLVFEDDAVPVGPVQTSAPPLSAGPRKSRAPVGIALLVGLIVVAGLIVLAVVLLGRGMDAGKGLSTDDQAVLRAALGFRFQAISDFNGALNRCAGPAGREAFARIDEALWPVSNPAAGWSQFLGTSLVCCGPGTAGRRTVAFYHPWSDVFLLTDWAAGEGGPPRLTGAEVLMGDCVRRGGEVPFDGAWAWKDGKTYPPLAFGRAAAATVGAFDRRFAGAGDWRDAVPALKDPRTLEANRYGAGIQVMRNLAELAPLLAPSSDVPQAGAVRIRLAAVLGMIKKGRLSEVLKEARETLPDASSSLRSFPIQDWERHRIAAYWASEGSGIVMLSKLDQTDRFMALMFTVDAGAARLRRIDTLSFRAFGEQ
jgi:pSer/pThr/pTyr-binding forkhead associated (FHA) protein